MLNPQVYRQMIASGGETVRWYKAFDALSYAPAAGLDDTRTDQHYDHGKLYIDQGRKRALVQSQLVKLYVPEVGLVTSSQLVLTAMPEEINLLPFDKVALLARTTMAREQLIRGPAAGSMVTPDKVGSLLPVVLLSVLDGTDTYEVGFDCTLDPVTRLVSWSGTHAPAAGDPYLVEYTCQQCYIFMGEGHRQARPAPESGELLPIKGVLHEAPPLVT